MCVTFSEQCMLHCFYNAMEIKALKRATSAGHKPEDAVHDLHSNANICQHDAVLALYTKKNKVLHTKRSSIKNDNGPNQSS